jgi:hypothetical protein
MIDDDGVVGLLVWLCAVWLVHSDSCGLVYDPFSMQVGIMLWCIMM